MGDTCIEMYLNEYISKFVEDENAKKRMLDLYERKEKELLDLEKYLHNCHERIDDLERTIIELSTIIGHDKYFIRRQIN